MTAPAPSPLDPVAERQTLQRMLIDAERLCRTADPLLQGQYAFLHGRIRALITITETAADEGEA